ncbi:TM2 domain-containing protein [Herminiimonas sp. CN]|uniref:TM2 domain-containing protein n=1 Tax=Herminiimonas sp. CN TaxID=1349818 RepID=UPI0009DD186F|nr:NINE protein [Herminiimonas sp. CN]
MECREKKQDEKFCHECGEIIRAKAEICPKCGCRQHDVRPIRTNGLDSVFSGAPEKSRTTAAALALLLGGFGAHKFYLGKPLHGILYAVFVLTFIPAFFGLVEGIHYITMSDDEFSSRLSNGTLNQFFGKK